MFENNNMIYCKFITFDPDITTILVLIVAAISVFVSLKALKIQRDHDYKSVRPIGQIMVGDYNNHIFVKISNCGIGPMLIKNIEVHNNQKVYNNLIDLFGGIALPSELYWNDFVKEIKGRAIRINEDLVLLELKDFDKPPPQHIIHYNDFLIRLKEVLAGTTIKVEYVDLYEENSFTIERHLNWFGRDSLAKRQLKHNTQPGMK